MRAPKNIPSSRAIKKSAASYNKKDIDCFVIQTTRNDKDVHQNGGVFFYILLAIILLAGLTYVVSQNNRGNTDFITDEQARVAATEIIEYGNTVANAVQKLRLRGCKDTEISFENNVASGYTNPNSPSDKSCHVFDITGGNINYLPIQPSWLYGSTSFDFYGETVFAVSCVENIGTHPISDSCNTPSVALLYGDLIFTIPWIKEKICKNINTTLFGSAAIFEDLNAYIHNTANFTGSYNIATAHVNFTSTDEESFEACITGSNTVGTVRIGRYGYYRVLIAR